MYTTEAKVPTVRGINSRFSTEHANYNFTTSARSSFFAPLLSCIGALPRGLEQICSSTDVRKCSHFFRRFQWLCCQSTVILGAAETTSGVRHRGDQQGPCCLCRPTRTFCTGGQPKNAWGEATATAPSRVAMQQVASLNQPPAQITAAESQTCSTSGEVGVLAPSPVVPVAGWL